MCGEAGCRMVASPPSACLPACCPRPGMVPVPGTGFKFVNNFTLGLVDVNRAREVLPTACTCLPASSLFSFHYASSPGGLSLSFFLLSSGTCAALSSCPTGGLVWALYHSLLSHVSLCFISWLCPVLSSSIPTLGQLLLPSRPWLSFWEAPVWVVQTNAGVVGQASGDALRSLSPTSAPLRRCPSSTWPSLMRRESRSPTACVPALR